MCSYSMQNSDNNYITTVHKRSFRGAKDVTNTILGKYREILM